jgi:hypothetical protein
MFIGGDGWRLGVAVVYWVVGLGKKRARFCAVINYEQGGGGEVASRAPVRVNPFTFGGIFYGPDFAAYKFIFLWEKTRRNL